MSGLDGVIRAETVYAKEIKGVEMAKKSKSSKPEQKAAVNPVNSEISPVVEEKYKFIIKIMSWTVAICFLIVITLPNFDFEYLDIVIKFVFFLGVFNLFIFIILEFIGESLQRYFSKKVQ